MKFRQILVFCCLLFTALFFAQPNTAQTQGRFSGEVTDPTGASVANATVTIENLGTHVKRVLQTNDNGDFVAPGIEPGFYSITVEANGFVKTVREKVQIEVGNDLSINFQLKPGGVNEVIEVKDEAPLTESTNAVLSGVLSNKAINDLPLQGRDFQNLLPLHPGVQRTPGGGFHSLTSNGLRPDDNNFIIDGANDNDVYYGESVVNDAGIQGAPASTLPLDAIQEFNTQEQPQADFGQKPGVVVNIGIKSGSDALHGTAYYFHRNQAFDARNYFNPKPQETSALLLHQFGGSLGGAFIKTKWFYFVNYEGVRDKVGNPYNVFTPVTTSLATPDNPDGDPRSSIVDALHAAGCDVTPGDCNALSMSLIKYFPNNPGYTADSSDPTIINFNFKNQQRQDNLVFKSDWHPNDKNTVSGRFIYANSNAIEEDASPVRAEWLSQAKPITQVFGIDWTYVPNSRWVNTARFSYNYFYEKIAPQDSNVSPADYGLNTGITDPRLFGFPRINPSTSYFNYLGGNSSWPLYTTPSKTLNYADTVSYTVGKHTLRFGGTISGGDVGYLRAPYGRGRVDFHYLPDFLAGNVRSWALSFGDPARDISMQSRALFFQDDFRITRRITLNLGLRYDVTNPIRDANNLLANYDPTQGLVQAGSGSGDLYPTNKKDFSPRVGVAWDVFGTGRTVLRSGFGMIYVQPSIRTFVASGAGLNINPSGIQRIINNTDGSTTTLPGTGTITTFELTGADPGLINWIDSSTQIFPIGDNSINGCSPDVPCNIFGVDQKLKTPYVLNWNLNLQQQIAPNTMLQVAYVANHGVHLYSTTDLNQANPAISGPCIGPNFDGDFFDCEQQARPLTTNCPTSVLGGLGTGGSCFPYIGYLNYLSNLSSSNYNSLQVTLTKRYSKGLYLLAGYTYGHAIDTAGSTSNNAYVPQNSLDLAADRASGDYDLRHRFTVSVNYDLPGRHGFAQMLEGWQINSLATVQTGAPLAPYDNYNDFTGTGEGPGNANNDRWNISGNPNNIHTSADHPIPFLANTTDDDDNIVLDPVCASVATTPGLLLATQVAGGCFAQNGTILYANAPYTFGNMGRNILRGPGFVNWDASIGKMWKLRENLKLQFRGEVFNILNHPNFSSTGIDLTSPDSFGRSSSTPDVSSSNPVIGSGGSRHIQLGLKFIW